MAFGHDEEATGLHCNLFRSIGCQNRHFEFSIQDVEQLVGVGMKLPRTRVTGEATDVYSAGAERRELRKRSGVFLGRCDLLRGWKIFEHGPNVMRFHVDLLWLDE